MSVPPKEVVGMDTLPDELILYIFKYLPLDTIVECETVCNRWKKISRDLALWRGLVFVYNEQPPSENTKKKKKDEAANTLLILHSHRECIRCLKLQYVYCYAKIRSIFDQCPNLISLELVMCRIGKEFEEDIMRWPDLRSINLKNSIVSRNNVDIIISYDNFEYLNYLALSDFGLPKTTRESLFRCQYLSHIFIDKVKDLTLDYVKKLITSKTSILCALHIHGGDSVDDECLLMLSRCKELSDLAIIHCEGLSDAGLIKLTVLKKLQHLQIWNNVSFTEMNLKRTLLSSNLLKLRSLSLSRIENISPETIDMIADYYKNLEFLSLYQCPKFIKLNSEYEKELKDKFHIKEVVLY